MVHLELEMENNSNYRLGIASDPMEQSETNNN